MTGAVALTAFLGNRTSKPGLRIWYSLLRKPPWNPPRKVFGPAWTALYALIAASGYRVFCAPKSPERTRALGLWATQLALNGTWSWLFFGKRRVDWALGDLPALALDRRLREGGGQGRQAGGVDDGAVRRVGRLRGHAQRRDPAPKSAHAGRGRLTARHGGAIAAS